MTKSHIFVLFLIFKVFTCLELDKNEANFGWSQYKAKYELSFEGQEDDVRKEIYIKNLKFINEFNAKNDRSFTLEVNKFAHLKTEEHPKGMRMRKKTLTQSAYQKQKPYLPIPKSKDWRHYGVVSPVKNQGDCGSCYAFSAIDAIESHYAIKTGVLDILSEQEIVDCSDKYGNAGCDGGYPDSVFEYAMENDIVSENYYPYQAEGASCKRNKLLHRGKRLYSYIDIPKGDEASLTRAIGFVGPVSIALDANHDEFMFYKEGIFSIKNCSTENLDHAVLAVGYKLIESGKSYLIVKNSWGSDWGEDGYFRIELGKNMCGIATASSYPIPKA